MITSALTRVNAMGITASVFINNDEGGLHQDYDDWLEQLVPHEPISRYRHNRNGEDNRDAHLKWQVRGREVAVRWRTVVSTLAPGSRSSKARWNGRPVSLDGLRCKWVLARFIGE